MKKPFKCKIGFHTWGPWEDVPYPTEHLDPGGWFWPMQQKKRKCECCGVEDWQER